MNRAQLNRLDGISKMYTDEKIASASFSVATASTYAYIDSQMNYGLTTSISYTDGRFSTFSTTSATPSLQQVYDVGQGINITFNQPIVIATTYSTESKLITIGNSNGYSEFEKDGTYHMIGSASVWNDSWFYLISAQYRAGTEPNLTEFQEGIYQYQFQLNDEVYGTIELGHDYNEKADLELHIHWADGEPPSPTDRSVRWELGVQAAAPGDTFTSPLTMNAEDTIIGGVSSRNHFKSIFDNVITGTTLKIGSIITFRLKRIPSTHPNGDPDTDPFGFAVGIHYECDTVGSRTIYSK